jgi:hypothetical protein
MIDKNAHRAGASATTGNSIDKAKAPAAFIDRFRSGESGLYAVSP